MPVNLDLLSNDILAASARRGNAPDTPVKTKGKSAKSKRKNEAAAEQASKEKAVKEMKGDDSMQRPPSPPSPSFAPSAPLGLNNGLNSPVLTALGDRAFEDHSEAKPYAIGIEVSPPGRSGDARAYPGSPRSAQHFQGEETRGGFSNHSPSTSPLVSYRPPSKQPNASSNLATSPRGRPASMPTHYPQGPPLPHPQFYYGLKDLSTAAKPSRSRSRKTVDRDYIALDTIPPPMEDATTTGDACLVLASQDSLHIHKVDIDGLQALGHIQGLRGRVVAAKIIPSAERQDQLRMLRPLVAVIVHGPALPSQDMSLSQQSEFDPSESLIGALRMVGEPATQQFQTSVEVYSLRERKHVTTLYKCPPIDIMPGERHSAPSGVLSLQAKGRFITITSAISGEVYIYEASKPATGQAFQCIGKTWTSLPSKKGRTWSTSSASSEIDGSPEGSDLASSADSPIISLSHRWLAIAPPVPSSRSTLHGNVDSQLLSTRPPGVNSHTSGSQPPVTCELDTPLEESRFNKVTRDVTQEVLKGARWVGDQGMQAWKNYWNKPPDSNIPYDHNMAVQFPPTHANEETSRANQQATLVSILDLERLSESQEAKPEMGLQPIAAFSLSDGCSFLSFNPTGLQLLTASTKGDVNFVWDLMRMQYEIPSANRAGALVRQIARFSRVTTANIVDVVWTEPGGEKLAILTDRGTVHVHDITPAAFQWPPPKAKRPAHARIGSSDAATSQPPSAGWSAAFNAVSGGAQPILAAVRGNPLPAFSNFNLAAAGTGAGVKGGKLVANGISKSVGAATDTVKSLRHMGDNRLHVSHAVGTGFVRWLVGKDLSAIIVLGEATLRIHSILSNSDVKGSRNKQSAVGLRMAEFTLPKLQTVVSDAPSDGYIIGGQWPPVVQRPKPDRVDAQPISRAEIETSAPYQACHTDPRIKFFIYQDSNHRLEDSIPWVFGEVMSVTRLGSGPEESDESPPSLESSVLMKNLASHTYDDETVPQVVTTTRKKRSKRAMGNDTNTKDENFDSGSIMVDWAVGRE